MKTNGTIKLSAPADYVIDVINPFTWFQAFKKIQSEQADLVIAQWAVYFFSYFYVPIFELVRRFTKTKIMFDCHNILPHEHRVLASSFTKLGLREADCFLVHSDKDLNELLKLIHNPVVKKARIPIYEDFNRRAIKRPEARKILGVDGNVMLFFGLIREYKGVIYLLRSLPRILEKIKVTLIIAGEFWDDKQKYLDVILDNSLSDYVRIVDRYIPNEEVETYFSSSDLVVLPYVSATQTAVISLAVGFDKPVLCTNAGGLPELVEDGVTGMIVPPRDEKALADAVAFFFQKDKAQEFATNTRKNRNAFSWDKMIETIEQLAQLTNRGRFDN